MAKTNTSATETSADVVDRELLETVALDIFIDMSKTNMRGFEPPVVAKRAFSRAKAFCQVAEAIRNGEAIADEVPDNRPSPMVSVHLWDKDGKPMFDSVTGQPVVRDLPGDRFAFAPNLPKDHPINQRFHKAREAMASNN